jgi:hypothetical protein
LSKTEYRRAVPRDLKGIVELGEKMHEETAFSNIPFSIERTASEAMRCMLDPNYFANIALKDGKVVWYVDISCRNTMVGPRLLKQFETWVKMYGGSIVFTTLGSNYKSDRVGKLMERMDFEYQGGFYRKDI